jgi:hypothetical protein
MAFISVVFGSLKVQKNNWSPENLSAKTQVTAVAARS